MYGKDVWQHFSLKMFARQARNFHEKFFSLLLILYVPRAPQIDLFCRGVLILGHDHTEHCQTNVQINKSSLEHCVTEKFFNNS